MGKVVSYPANTLAAESPTKMTSTPPSSNALAVEKSYPVNILIFSPFSFISRMDEVVIRLMILFTDISIVCLGAKVTIKKVTLE
jgi:hypothetical protein